MRHDCGIRRPSFSTIIDAPERRDGRDYAPTGAINKGGRRERDATVSNGTGGSPPWTNRAGGGMGAPPFGRWPARGGAHVRSRRHRRTRRQRADAARAGTCAAPLTAHRLPKGHILGRRNLCWRERRRRGTAVDAIPDPLSAILPPPPPPLLYSVLTWCFCQ